MVSIETGNVYFKNLMRGHRCDFVVDLGRKAQMSTLDIAFDILEKVPDTQVPRANSVTWSAGTNQIGTTSINPCDGAYRMSSYTAKWLMECCEGFELLQDHPAALVTVKIFNLLDTPEKRELANSVSHIVQELFHDPEHPQLWVDQVAIPIAKVTGRYPYGQ